MDGHAFWETFILLILLILLRIFYLIHKITTGYSKISPKGRTKPVRTLICVGSGGHTTEIVSLLYSINFENYNPRYYVLASSDATSLLKIKNLEADKKSNKDDWTVCKIPRSRDVHQSYITSVFTTLVSIFYSIPIVIKINPELILCNGPGTCVPVCIVAFLLKVAFITDTKIVFIESFCRTKSLSLTGKILLYFADNFLVQWPTLKDKYKRTEYIGQLL